VQDEDRNSAFEDENPVVQHLDVSMKNGVKDKVNTKEVTNLICITDDLCLFLISNTAYLTTYDRRIIYKFDVDYSEQPDLP